MKRAANTYHQVSPYTYCVPSDGSGIEDSNFRGDRVVHRKPDPEGQEREIKRVEEFMQSSSNVFRLLGEPTDTDIEILNEMVDWFPRTHLKTGDLVVLNPTKDNLLRYSMSGDPQTWQIRFVVSAYQFELHNIIQRYPNASFDQALVSLEGRGMVRPHQYRMPVVYAHGFPHGLWPDSARWFPGHALKKLVLRAPNQHWPGILDEFKTPFYGYDTDLIRSRFVMDLAPDLYSRGKGGKPLSHEEETFHSACLMGLEHNLVFPASINRKTPGHEIWDGTIADPDNPIRYK